MSANNGNDRHPSTRTDTVIGAGLRLDGNIACSGVVRILGEVHGDIACDADSNATVIVGASGSITGETRAPHIIVAGNILGPVVSSESIEIQPGANVAGDILYHAIQIHPGGVIQGRLNPESTDDEQGKGRRPGASGTTGAAAIAADDATGGRRLSKPPLPVAWTAAAVAVFGAIATIVVLNSSPEPATAPVAEVPGSAPPARQDGSDLAAVPRADAPEQRIAPEPPQQSPAADSEKVVTIQGVNPGKPGSVFSVVGKQPSALIRKKRDEAAEGTRIEIPQGAAASIPFARDDIFRVVQGRDIEIFYQGRKVGPKTIESGAWMSFVPQSSGAAGK